MLFGAVREQATTWANLDLDLCQICCHSATASETAGFINIYIYINIYIDSIHSIMFLYSQLNPIIQPS